MPSLFSRRLIAFIKVAHAYLSMSTARLSFGVYRSSTHSDRLSIAYVYMSMLIAGLSMVID